MTHRENEHGNTRWRHLFIAVLALAVLLVGGLVSLTQPASAALPTGDMGTSVQQPLVSREDATRNGGLPTDRMPGSSQTKQQVSKPKGPSQGTPTPTSGSTLTPTAIPPCGLAWRIVSGPDTGGTLLGVAVVSANDVWAVGGEIQHWNGSAWSIVPSPNPGPSTLLWSVAVVSANDVWAVGKYGSSFAASTLTEHWDGTQWSVVPSPNPGANSNQLRGVAVVSTNDVWAVGVSVTNNMASTLIEHWDGTQWSVVPSPNVQSSDNFLQSVTAVSANDAWAVGQSYDGQGATQTLTLHWNGSAWSIVPSPNVGPSSNALYDVEAVSSNDVWAVGTSFINNAEQTLTMRWNGTQWNVVPSLSGSGPNFLFGVTVVSASDVWAVGWYGDFLGEQTLTMRWNGSAWSIVSSPSPGLETNELRAVAAVSSNNIWAVGHYQSNYVGHTLIEHYNDPCVTPSPTSVITNTATRTLTPSPPANTATRTATEMATGTATSTPANTATPCSGRVTICHRTGNGNSHTITVSCSALPAHLQHGDTLGACPMGTPRPRPNRFSDVRETDFFFNYVLDLNDDGALGGYSDGTFRPYNQATRGQFVKIVVLAFHIPLYQGNEQHFSDVPPGSTFYSYIETARRDNIIGGYSDGTFRPNANVTRGQITKIAVEAAGMLDLSTNRPSFSDVPVGSTFYNYIETAYANGILSGYADGTFRPYNDATRGQVTKIVDLATHPDR